MWYQYTGHASIHDTYWTSTLPDNTIPIKMQSNLFHTNLQYDPSRTFKSNKGIIWNNSEAVQIVQQFSFPIQTSNLL